MRLHDQSKVLKHSIMHDDDRSLRQRCLSPRLVCWLALFFVSGCMLFAPQEREKIPLDLPRAYQEPGNGTQELNAWWTGFGSQELSSLIEQALHDNFDIRIAWSRLKQARAEARKAGADLVPHLDGESRLERSRTWEDGSRDSLIDEFSLALAASYEIDLWGRIQSGRQAEVLSSNAARQDVDAAAISVAGEVAGAWIDLLALRQEADVVRQQIQTNTTLYDLQLNRFAYGQADALAVTQQEEALAASRSDLPGLKAEIELTHNSLARLLGLAERQKLKLKQKALPRPIPLPKTGLPADLIASRPDIRAAWYRLQSADWQLVRAKAARLPKLSLTARGSLSGSSLDQALSSWFSNLAAGLTAPLLDGGGLQAEVDRSRAAAEERVLSYGQTVVQAVLEVQDALFREAHRRETAARLEEQLQAARKAQSQAKISYLQGQSSYLDFLLQLKNVQSLERRLLATRARLLKDRVALYRALGTAWPEGLPEAT